MPGYESIRAGVRGDWCRGTMGLEPGYEGISAGVRVKKDYKVVYNDP